jgi:hypothetical protein
VAIRHDRLELMHKERNMKLNQKSGASIAMTAAALLISGALMSSAAAADAKGKCTGVNGCAGKSACKTATNDCKGQNACKGKGWVEMTQEECTSAGGTFEKS